MPHLPGLGSQTMPALLHRAGLSLKAEVQRHSLELTTGRAADPARRLRGDLGALGAIETRLGRIAARDQVIAVQLQRAAAVQAGLSQVATVQENLRAATLTAASGEAAPAALARLGAQGRQALEDMIAALARGLAGEAVFAGDRTDTTPLASASAFLSAAATAVAGATSAQDAAQLVRDMFNLPGGAFATMLYTGGNPVAPSGDGTDGALAPWPTAADPALRGALAGAVLAALAGDPAAVPGLDLRRGLVVEAVRQQAAAAGGLVDLQAAVGVTEASLAERRTRLSVERDALETSREGRIGVDPYEAATRLEEARARLESLYVVTARVARLSLTEYLR